MQRCSQCILQPESTERRTSRHGTQATLSIVVDSGFVAYPR